MNTPYEAHGELPPHLHVPLSCDTTRRFPRSLAEAFPDERYPAVRGPYRRPGGADVPVMVGCALAALFLAALLVAERFA